MFVTKRNGQKENVQFDKITERIKRLIRTNEIYLDPVIVAQKTISGIYNGITTEELDLESAKIAVNLATIHPSYALLGGRILVSNLHKKTSNSFVDKMVLLNDTYKLNQKWISYLIDNKDVIDGFIDYNQDYKFDYFGFSTLTRSYLLKQKDVIIERPQDMFMRVASFLNMGSLDMIKKTYDLMSEGYYVHASPTLFNAGTLNCNLSSCFLLGIDDSLEEITKCWNSCAAISKWSGGIGLHVSNIRAKNSLIKGTGGLSQGMIPFLRVFNDIARYIDQGGRRPGSIAIYLEPHHADIFSFLELKKNFGAETERARDLFYALYISDLFMKQVEANSDWYLMSPDECPGLNDVYGSKYESLYWSYVEQGKYREKVSAQKLWTHILDSQIETGTPYILFKDSINKKSNQKNIGIIRSSNLCVEICEYSDADEYAVCNLASIALNKFVKPFSTTESMIIYVKENCSYCHWAKLLMNHYNIGYTEVAFSEESVSKLRHLITKNDCEGEACSYQKITFPQIFTQSGKHIGTFTDLYKFTSGTFDWSLLYEVAYTATRNLNQVIDINYYPVIQAKKSNMKHRPIGLGIQGLADALALLKINYDSEEAVAFNSRMQETIYFASMTASNDMAMERAKELGPLVKYIHRYLIKVPEYYDETWTLEDGFNEVYHKLKPCSFELDREPDISTIGSYSTFDGAPLSYNRFQFDLHKYEKEKLHYDWSSLRSRVSKYGVRNSLVCANMPTASTSQILGNNECFEWFTNNIYSRKTLAGDFPLVNKYLVNDLLAIGAWSVQMKDMILGHNGSIQKLNIPPVIKDLYKTIWEIKQVWVLKQAIARAPFVDQSQSMNIFMAEPDYQRLTSSHFYAWRNGLKTGMYYLRTKPATDAIKFTVDPSLISCESCSA